MNVGRTCISMKIQSWYSVERMDEIVQIIMYLKAMCTENNIVLIFCRMMALNAELKTMVTKLKTMISNKCVFYIGFSEC